MGKSRTVRIAGAAVVRSIDGTVTVQIKKLPSNRVWWGFTKMPEIDMEFIPEVGPKQITLSMVTNLLQKVALSAVSLLFAVSDL